jgi:hypothetical protein
MPPQVPTQLENVALLSAAGVTASGQAGVNAGALQVIAGSSVIGWQMAQLRRCDVTTFLIEVDSVTGELLNLADKFRNDGARVEFVRSVKDLQSFLKPGAKLFMLAEAHYFSAPTMSELTQTTKPFIATIDGRDENSGFERIDLNTRWAGFALLDASTARSLMELPEGWSITSSLLRHTIQCGLPFSPVLQGKVQNGEIARVSGEASANVLVDRILTERIDGATGLIERYIFGPIAKRAAPYLWASSMGVSGVDIVAHICAFASFGAGTFGWNIAAAATTLFAIFLHLIAGVIGGPEGSLRHRRYQLMFWSALVAAAFAAALTNADYDRDTAAFMAISIGLMAVSYKTALPRWSSGLLRSPALLASVMLIAAGLSAFSLGTKLTAMAQLVILIAGQYLPLAKRRNRNQA